MTKDDIIRMAREAGFDPHDMSDDFTCNLMDIERFAELVAAAEREACAVVAFNAKTYIAAANAIRARGQPEPWVKTYSGGKPNYTQPIEPEPMIDGWPLWSGLPPQEEQGLTATPLPAIKLQNQSEWHELTDGEIATIKTKYEFGVNSHSFINAIRELETWLKERNT